MLNKDFSKFTSTRSQDENIIKGEIIILNKQNENIIFKKYSWGSSGNLIEFLKNGQMIAFGKGNYLEIENNIIKANFGNESHILTFNENFSKFTSIREKDGQIINGCLIK